jgi:hypothetical protein
VVACTKFMLAGNILRSRDGLHTEMVVVLESVVHEQESSEDVDQGCFCALRNRQVIKFKFINVISECLRMADAFFPLK